MQLFQIKNQQMFKILIFILSSLLFFNSIKLLANQNPANSYVYGSNWYCNEGYKKIGNECQKMTPQEAERHRIQMQLLAAHSRKTSKEFYVDDEKFTLKEISRKCEVYRYSDNYGDVECSGSKFRVIERKCEAYFSGKYEKSGELECRGSELKPIERYCSTTMYSDSYGEIDC